MAPAVTSTAASLRLLARRFLSSASHAPRLPFARRPPPLILLPRSLGLLPPASPGSCRFTPIRCCANHSGDSSPPIHTVYGFRDPPGCYEESWYVIVDKPDGEGATRQQIVDFCVQTLAKVVGSEDEAKNKIYRVSCGGGFRFGCVIDEETSHKLRGLPSVLHVFPDPYVPEYKDYVDELKHKALNIKRYTGYSMNTWKDYEVVIHVGYMPKWYKVTPDMLMNAVEKQIQQLSVACEALDSDVQRDLLSRMDKVLNELSIHVKQLWNPTTKEAEQLEEKRDEQAMRMMKRLKKAIESLSLAQEAIHSLYSLQRDMISKAEQDLSELSMNVMKLLNVISEDAGDSAGTSVDAGDDSIGSRERKKVDSGDHNTNSDCVMDLDTILHMNPEDFENWGKKFLGYERPS